MPGGLFVPRLARRLAAQPGGGGPRRTGADHRRRHDAAVAAARGPAAAAGVRDHAAPRPGHQAHVVAAGPDAGPRGPAAGHHGPVHGARAGRLGRGPGDHLQRGAGRGDRGRPGPVSAGRAAAVVRATGVSRRGAAGAVGRAEDVGPDGRGGGDAARPPRRRRHHQEPGPRPDTRYPVAVGRQVGAAGRVAPSHGE